MCCDRRCLWLGLKWVGSQFEGGFACGFGVVVFVEYIGIGTGKVRVRGGQINNGDHGCGESGKLWKVKRWSSGEGARRNGGSGDQRAFMVSHIFL
jgi:hypothetical protein